MLSTSLTDKNKCVQKFLCKPTGTRDCTHLAAAMGRRAEVHLRVCSFTPDRVDVKVAVAAAILDDYFTYTQTVQHGLDSPRQGVTEMRIFA